MKLANDLFKGAYARKAASASAAALVVSATFELIEVVTGPRINPWESHLITISLYGILVFFLAFAFLKRGEKLTESNRFSESLMESLPGVVCIFDSSGNIRRWNRNFLGYSESEVLGSGIMRTVAPESFEATQEAMQAAFETGAAEEEAFLLAKSGAKIPCYLKGVRIAYQNQTCILGIAIDITKRKRAEENVRLQTAALESAANAVLITDARGTIQWVNRAFTALTGYSFDEALDQTPRLLKSGKQDRVFYESLWKTIAAGDVWSGEIINRRKNGELYTEEMTIGPVRSTSGDITNFIAIKQDVSERKRAEEEKHKLISLVENSADFIGIGSLSGETLYVNAAGRKLTGVDDGPLPGHVSEFHPQAAWKEISEVGLPAIMNEGHWDAETQFRNVKTGESIDMEMSFFLVRNAATEEPLCMCTVSRDIRERKRAQREILFKNALLESQTEATLDGILAVDASNKVILSNQRFQNIWAIPPQMIQEGDDARLLRYVVDQVENSGQFLEKVQFLYDHPDQKSKDEIRLKGGRVLDRYSSPLIDATGKYLGRIWYFRDVTETIHARERLQLWSQVLEHSAEGIFVCDPQERILLVNKAFEKLTGFSAGEIVGKTPRTLQSGRQDQAFYKEMWTSVLQTGKWQGEIWNRRKNGEFYVEWLSISAIVNSQGAVTHYIGIFADITSRKQDQDRILHLAHYDALTNLPNRALLLDRIEQVTKAAQRRNAKVAVLFVDLDRFKDVNDSLGHDIGDLLLRTLAERFSHVIRSEDTLARIGGDEFVAVIQGLREGQDAAVIARELLSCLIQPIILKGYEVTVTASIGISIYPDDTAHAQELIRNADAAMYQAKRSGRNAYHFYTSDLNTRALEMLSIESALRRAIERQEFVLHYQPQVDINAGSLIGAEALVRWKHPELGLVMPGKFISIAEERGLIVSIGNWVLEEAARQSAKWQKTGLSFPIAVNVSAVQFRQPDFFERLADCVRSHGIHPSRLELELTESIVMRNAATTIEILRKLHEAGFQLSIDDFGTGYSSLSYLRRFPVDKIKVDQSFMASVTNDEVARGIVAAIIGLARSLHLKVIAEGVQTREQLEILRDQNCDEAQGFLFSPALPADQFERLIHQWPANGLTLEPSPLEPVRR